MEIALQSKTLLLKVLSTYVMVLSTWLDLEYLGKTFWCVCDNVSRADNWLGKTYPLSGQQEQFPVVQIPEKVYPCLSPSLTLPSDSEILQPSKLDTIPRLFSRDLLGFWCQIGPTKASSLINWAATKFSTLQLAGSHLQGLLSPFFVNPFYTSHEFCFCKNLSKSYWYGQPRGAALLSLSCGL